MNKYQKEQAAIKAANKRRHEFINARLRNPKVVSAYLDAVDGK